MKNAMRAVIYARYSTDLQREASIEDQIRVCSERASREGWKVVGTYADRATSGASLSNRKGFKSLLDDARDRGFEIVLAEALDRISRDQEDAAAIYKRLRHYEVSIFTLSEGAIDEIQIGFKGTMNALFLKDLASKIRRGQRGRIASGLSAGGLTYGYEVVRNLDAEGNLERGKRKIKETEARIVRQIFEDYAAGCSPRSIAARLNKANIPAPRGGLWNASTINGHRTRRNGILQNEIYRGALVYNRVRMVKDPETGKRISRINPAKDWITVQVPEHRIVSDELWERVQGKRAVYSSSPAHKSRRAKRLLSGLLACGTCGGSFTIVRPGKYGCATHREKGTCSNGHQISVDLIESRVLNGVKQHLSQPHLLSEFVQEFRIELERLRAASAQSAPSASIDLQHLSKKIDRLVQAIAEGTDTPSLRKALLRLEAEKDSAEKHVASLVNQPPPAALNIDLPLLFRQKIDGLEHALRSDPSTTGQAASIFRTLIDRVVLSPGSGRGKMSVEVYGEPTALFRTAHAGNMKNDDWMIKVVAEEGFEPPTHGL